MSETPLFKQCPNCQQFSPEESSACLQCGHNFTPVQAPKEPGEVGGLEGLSGQPPKMPEEQAPKKRSGLPKFVLGALVIVVGGGGLLCVIVMIVAALLGDSPDSATSERPTNTPVPTFTSTPVGSTVTETTGQSDTRVQAQPTETSVPSTPIPPTATSVSRPMVTINSDMNVREGPGTDYPVIGGATVGQRYPVTGKNAAGDWWQIHFNGLAGWVYGPLVTPSNSANIQVAGVATANPTRTPIPRPTKDSRVSGVIPTITPSSYGTSDPQAWDLAYKLVFLDTKGSVENVEPGGRSAGIAAYFLFMQTASANCGLPPSVIAALAQKGTEILEEEGVFLESPRLGLVGGLASDEFVRMMNAEKLTCPEALGKLIELIPFLNN